jgi:hypothetical protein
MESTKARYKVSLLSLIFTPLRPQRIWAPSQAHLVFTVIAFFCVCSRVLPSGPTTVPDMVAIQVCDRLQGWTFKVPKQE